MKITTCTQINRDNLEPLFDAGNKYSFTYSNFVFDDNDDDILSFDINFPNNLTSADIIKIFRDYQLDELSDFLTET